MFDTGENNFEMWLESLSLAKPSGLINTCNQLYLINVGFSLNMTVVRESLPDKNQKTNKTTLRNCTNEQLLRTTRRRGLFTNIVGGIFVAAGKYFY